MMATIDGYTMMKDGMKSFALVSVAQKDHYGSYAAAMRSLGVDLILSPLTIDADERGDLPFFHEVGHA